MKIEKPILKLFFLLIIGALLLGYWISITPNYFQRDLKEVLAYSLIIIELIALISVVIGVYSYSINRKKLNFSVLQSCVERFHNLSDKLNEDALNINVLEKYVDLVNEELFYMANDYLPEEVKREWLDGMMDYIPLFDQSNNGTNKNINPSKVAQMIESNGLLQNYYRIRSAFTVRRVGLKITPLKIEHLYQEAGGNSQKARKKIIDQVLLNLKTNEK